MRRLSRVSTVVAMLCSVLVTACNSSTTSSSAAPTPVRCALTLSGTPPLVESGGGTGTVALTINRECAWSAKPEVGWISVSPASGQGESQISFSVASNQQPVERKGAIVINEQRFEVTQRAACAFTLSPEQEVAHPGGARVLVTVTAAAGCVWQAVSQVPWITVSAGASGAGPGTVVLDVSPGGVEARTGDVLIAGITFSVRQSAASPSPSPPPSPSPTCQFSLSASNAAIGSAGGSGSVEVIAPAGCQWTAQSSESWLDVTSGSTGGGRGEVRFTASPNTSSAPRTATLMIAGIEFRVTQAGAVATPECTYSLSSTAESVAAGGGSGAVSVIAPSGCAWTATSSASWLNVTSGSTGSGPGEVRFAASPNTSSAPRSATLTIAGIVFSVTQAGGAPIPQCTYAVSSTAESVAAAGGSGAITVTAPSGCAWTATSSASWLTVTAGASGSGNGTVQYSAAAHTTTSPRSASLTIATQTVTVNQEAAAAPTCSFTVSPSTVEAPAGGLTASITVTASASSCAWTASASPSWITLTGPSEGTGSATIAFSVAENTSTSSRTGAIVVGGEDVAISQAAAPPSSPTVSGEISSLEGQCPTLTFLVDARTVRTTSSTKFMGGSCNGLDDGDDVTVEGTVESDNSITATSVRKN
jgi:hypothetical protein